MFRMYKLKNNSEYLLYESEVKDGSNPQFKRVIMNEKKLCNNNPDQPIILKMYDYSNFGAPKYIAETKFTVTDIHRGKINYYLRNK